MGHTAERLCEATQLLCWNHGSSARHVPAVGARDRVRYRCRRMPKASNQDVGLLSDLETKLNGTTRQERVSTTQVLFFTQEACSNVSEVDDLRPRVLCVCHSLK